MLYVDAGTPPALVALALVPMALGGALTVPPLTAATMDAVPAERAGLAAGVLNAARQMAGGLSIAVFGALIADGFVAGMRLSLLISAALIAVTGRSAAVAQVRRPAGPELEAVVRHDAALPVGDCAMKPTRAAPVSFSSPSVKSRTKVQRSPSREAWKAKARPLRLTRNQTELPSTVKELQSSE